MGDAGVDKNVGNSSSPRFIYSDLLVAIIGRCAVFGQAYLAHIEAVLFPVPSRLMSALLGSLASLFCNVTPPPVRFGPAAKLVACKAASGQVMCQGALTGKRTLCTGFDC